MLPQLVAPTPRSQELRVQKLCNALSHSTSRCGAAPSCAWAAWTRGSCSSTASRASATRPVIAALKPHVHLQTVALHDGKFQGDSVTNAITRAGLYRETPRAVFATTS